jgi:hypothetical protein
MKSGLSRATSANVEHLARSVVDFNPDTMPHDGLPNDPDEFAIALDDMRHRQVTAIRIVLHGCSSDGNDIVA